MQIRKHMYRGLWFIIPFVVVMGVVNARLIHWREFEMQNTFTSLLNRAGAMKGRLLLGVAGILCAIMAAALVAPVLTPSIQGAEVPQEKLVFQQSSECSAMYGCVSD
ncbi:MAG: hypothetical protein F4Y61_00590 [Rhodothermaceae bacterium]|nr:hypothetical protein [Rhodothermaceae bacterium]